MYGRILAMVVKSFQSKAFQPVLSRFKYLVPENASSLMQQPAEKPSLHTVFKGVGLCLCYLGYRHSRWCVAREVPSYQNYTRASCCSVRKGTEETLK